MPRSIVPKVERVTPAPFNAGEPERRRRRTVKADDDLPGSAQQNSDESDSPDSSPGPFSQPSRNGRHNHGNPSRTLTMNGKSGFQRGAIVRVKLKNFVTYKNAEFRPGPQLNMVIGPNGTGKSSLVCAICIGLGFHPKIMGRADGVGDYVKHGHDDAEVEIELADEPANHVIGVRISKKDNHRSWSLNRKGVPHKEIKRLVASLHVQIDNLCQFLPQEKVASFAGLTPVELLRETLRAAAPEHMSTWHDELVQLHSDQKVGQIKMDEVNVQLRGYTAQQQEAELDVQRLRERESSENKIEDLRVARLAKMYVIARDEFKNCKEGEMRSRKALRKLANGSEPSMRAVRSKEDYHSAVQRYVANREAMLQQAGSRADAALGNAESCDTRMRSLEGAMEAEHSTMEKFKKDVGESKAQIHRLRVQLDKTPPPFDAQEWNQKINQKRHEAQDIQQDIDNIAPKMADLKPQYLDKAAKATKLGQEIAGLDSREGQSMALLQRSFPDIYAANEWINNNQDKFEKEVYGPPMLNCSLKDERYGDLVQSLMGENDALAFTCQTIKDHKVLSEQIFRVMRLNTAIRTCTKPLSAFRSPTTRESLEALSLDGYAIDYLQGPEPVLAMLCSTARLHLAAVSLKELSEDEYNRIAEGRKVTSFSAGTQNYRIVRRHEYGDRSISTTRSIRRGQYWTDQPVDGSYKAQLEERLANLHEEMKSLKSQNETLRDERAQLQAQHDRLEEARSQLSVQKHEEQRAHTQYQALPKKIRQKEEELQKHMQDIRSTRDKRQGLLEQLQQVMIDKAAAALAHKRCVDDIRRAHSELVEARLMLLEAESEVDALRAKNQEIVSSLEQARRDHEAAVAEAARTKQTALDRKAEYEEEASKDEERGARAQVLAETMSLEEIETDIVSEESKLSLIHDVPDGVLARYQAREREISRLTRDLGKAQEGLEAVRDQVAELRGQWEPELDRLIGLINDAFGHNFEQLGCAGEVAVHKDEDFEKWAVQIRVRFRENESLQILDQHRQSGGERAVTTIFYLMSLQSMAQAPFRVVDEINQGMDPRNERMVHERMVDIACREHTSQYFLITPKLLTGLKYDPGMTVLCIASGESMPDGAADKMDFRAMVERRKQVLRMKAEARG